MISGQRCLVRGRVTEAGEFLEFSSRGPAVPDRERCGTERDPHAGVHPTPSRAHHEPPGKRDLDGFAPLCGHASLARVSWPQWPPLTYVDLDTDKTSQELLDRFEVKLEEIPVVICDSRTVLRNPSIQELAECLGLNTSVDSTQVRDLIIVGAGPSGLAAAVYGASEGLDTLLIETESPGGQAGSSSKIENYLGFPTGVSGQELAARALTQAQKFGAKMMVAHSVVRLNCDTVLQAGSGQRQRALGAGRCHFDRGAVQEAGNRQSEEV